jgi:hypothetical protein
MLRHTAIPLVVCMDEHVHAFARDQRHTFVCVGVWVGVW